MSTRPQRGVELIANAPVAGVASEREEFGVRNCWRG